MHHLSGLGLGYTVAASDLQPLATRLGCMGRHNRRGNIRSWVGEMEARCSHAGLTLFWFWKATSFFSGFTR